MLSAVVYVTLRVWIARFVARRRLKFYFLGLALLLTCAVGISRVYMRVHYSTDVLAGAVAFRYTADSVESPESRRCMS